MGCAKARKVAPIRCLRKENQDCPFAESTPAESAWPSSPRMYGAAGPSLCMAFFTGAVGPFWPGTGVKGPDQIFGLGPFRMDFQASGPS